MIRVLVLILLFKRKEDIKDKGFGRDFVCLSKDSEKDYSDRIYLAYWANNFYPTTTKNNFEMTENQYALTELWQFMFKSALSRSKEIWIYIPSIRMRNLLKQWIKQRKGEIEVNNDKKIQQRNL